MAKARQQNNLLLTLHISFMDQNQATTAYALLAGGRVGACTLWQFYLYLLDETNRMPEQNAGRLLHPKHLYESVSEKVGLGLDTDFMAIKRISPQNFPDFHKISSEWEL